MDKMELSVALSTLSPEQYLDQCLSMVLHHEEVGLIARVIRRIRLEEKDEIEGAEQ